MKAMYNIELKSKEGKIEVVTEKCSSFSDAESKAYPNVFCHGYEILSITKITE
jgi:hypothetical protein